MKKQKQKKQAEKGPLSTRSTKSKTTRDYGVRQNTKREKDNYKMLIFSPIRRSEYNATLFLSPIVTKIKFPSINSLVGLIKFFRLIKGYKNQWKSFLWSFHRLSSFQCAFCWCFARRNVVFVFTITYSPISHTCLPR